MVRFVYGNTYCPEKSKKEEPLRRLLSHFAAWNLKSLEGDTWDELVSEGGDFARDLHRKSVLRMRGGQVQDNSEDCSNPNEWLPPKWCDPILEGFKDPTGDICIRSGRPQRQGNNGTCPCQAQVRIIPQVE